MLPLKNSGFTLLETMFALAIFATIVFFFPMIISSFQTSDEHQLRMKEVELFFIQIRQEIHQAIQLTEGKNALYVTLKNGEVATYERYGTSIRRRLNDEGHEIMLQHVRHVSFQTNQNVVTIHITGIDGQQFERKMATMVKTDE